MGDEPDLGLGDSSEWVTYLQQMLNHHYEQVVVDEHGFYDDATASAVAHFRAQRGLPESNSVDAQFWDTLLGR